MTMLKNKDICQSQSKNIFWTLHTSILFELYTSHNMDTHVCDSFTRRPEYALRIGRGKRTRRAVRFAAKGCQAPRRNWISTSTDAWTSRTTGIRPGNTRTSTKKRSTSRATPSTRSTSGPAKQECAPLPCSSADSPVSLFAAPQITRAFIMIWAEIWKYLY